MKKNIFLWALYDMANSVLVAALGGLYLGQWLILDKGLDDIWYGVIFAMATVLLLFTSPFWGSWSDAKGERMPFIKWSTYCLIFFGFLIALVIPSQFFSSYVQIAIVLILFLILQYSYQLSLVFYDALLVKLATPETYGRISGIGDAFNELGWILGPAILLPFATGAIVFFGEPGRTQVFLPAVILMAVFSLPMIFWFKEPKKESIKTDFKTIYATTISGLKNLVQKDKNVTRFLIGYCFISDAILTVELYFAVFLDQIYQITDTQKFYALAVMQIFAVPSSYLIGRLSDHFNLKKTLISVCVGLVVVFSLLPLFSSLEALLILAAFAGVGWGGFYTTSRALLVKIAPEKHLGEYFGFYATFHRFASIIGPLTWGAIVLLLKQYGVIKYNFAMLSLAVLMLIGAVVLLKVKEKKSI